jgi:surface carbohydrate biosynthesis protein
MGDGPRGEVTGPRPDVLILYEKAAREVDVACVLSALLGARHGMTVEIVQQNHPPPRVLRSLRPDVVVLPFCYQQRSNNAYFVRWPDAVFFNLSWEQFFYPGNAVAKTPRGDFAVRHVLHHAWSEAYAALLRDAGVPESSIFLNGNPALALYDKPYRTFFQSRAQLAALHQIDPGRRWVFFPENYNWAFYEPSMLDQMVRDGQPREQVDAMRIAVTQSYEAAMNWCATLARTTDVQVILRPRPATPVDVFARRTADVIGPLPDGLSIIQDQTVRDWILSSEVVVSSYSTSLIEASVAGRPAYLVEPTPWPKSLHQPWHALVPRLTSSEQFVSAAYAAEALAGNALATWARSNLFGSGDPIVSLADRIAAVRRRDVPVPPRAPWQATALPNRWHLPGRMINGVRRTLRPWLRGNFASVTPDTRADVVAMETIPTNTARWKVVLGL